MKPGIKITTITLGIVFILSILSVGLYNNNKNIDDINFNHGWQFKKGLNEGAEKLDFDDSDWRTLNLPHDWAIEGDFSSQYNARTGGLEVHGTAWYRKTFTVDKKYKDKVVSIEFDGAMNNAHLWVNGEFVGKRPFGYIGFEFDLTSHIKFGQENTISVRLSPEDLSSRWYPGAGIYRNVRLKINNPIHIAQWGTYITTPKIDDQSATTKIVTLINNKNNCEQSAKLRTTIFNKDGQLVSEKESDIVLQANASGYANQELTIQNPLRWDLDSPYLYKVVSEIHLDGKVIDIYESDFGIRDISFTAEGGFKLNGRSVKFKGVCMHHDLGPLGSAVNYRATERQVQIMKKMGVNAIRTSHNPPSPELLQICDRLGVLVQVEAFDEWKIAKVVNGYNKYFDEWHEKDLRDMIKRDRNHPSVIMWSIGNEILEQGRKDGWKLTKHLNDICHDEDPTRPTTAGFNYFPAPFTNKLANQIDVVGLNYWPLNYQEVLDNNPNMIVYGSETSSQTSSRGIYHLPIDAMQQHQTNQASSYDVIVGPPWAYPPDVEFEQQEKVNKSLGEFMWTGFDYLGEPTPYGGRDNSTHGYWNDDWPSHSSYFAPVDLCGFPKDRFYLYQSQWTEEPMVHVLPHWNWEGMEGTSIPVYAYTNCEQVELFVNGKSLGKKTKGVDLTPIPAEFHGFEKGTYQSKYRLSWDVPYQPGEIKVVASTNGEVLAEKSIKTAGKPVEIKLSADRSILKANDVDLSFITVEVLDENGIHCPTANNLIEFNVNGQGTIAGVGNGNSASLEPLQSDKISLFSGKALLIISATNKKGEISITASSKGLPDATIRLKSN